MFNQISGAIVKIFPFCSTSMKWTILVVLVSWIGVDCYLRATEPDGQSKTKYTISFEIEKEKKQ